MNFSKNTLWINLITAGSLCCVKQGFAFLLVPTPFSVLGQCVSRSPEVWTHSLPLVFISASEHRSDCLDTHWHTSVHARTHTHRQSLTRLEGLLSWINDADLHRMWVAQLGKGIHLSVESFRRQTRSSGPNDDNNTLFIGPEAVLQHGILTAMDSYTQGQITTDVTYLCYTYRKQKAKSQKSCID